MRVTPILSVTFLCLFFASCSNVRQTQLLEKRLSDCDYSMSLTNVLDSLWLTHKLALVAPEKVEITDSGARKTPPVPDEIYTRLKSPEEFALLAHYAFDLAQTNPTSEEYMHLCLAVFYDCIYELSNRADESAGRSLLSILNHVHGAEMPTTEVNECIERRERIVRSNKKLEQSGHAQPHQPQTPGQPPR